MGTNWRAVTAALLGILPCLPGFLRNVLNAGAVKDPNFFDTLYTYAWFVSFFVSFAVYCVLMLAAPPKPVSSAAAFA
jgi:NCS1 family nucleobase:cation symporter-1